VHDASVHYKKRGSQSKQVADVVGLSRRKPTSSIERVWPQLDIVIPVYNEVQKYCLATLGALAREVKIAGAYPDRLYLTRRTTRCGDPQQSAAHAGIPWEFVRNPGRGAHKAVKTGCRSTAPYI